MDDTEGKYPKLFDAATAVDDDMWGPAEWEENDCCVEEHEESLFSYIPECTLLPSEIDEPGDGGEVTALLAVVLSDP